jgi:hypothetical protein
VHVCDREARKCRVLAVSSINGKGRCSCSLSPTWWACICRPRRPEETQTFCGETHRVRVSTDRDQRCSPTHTVPPCTRYDISASERRRRLSQCPTYYREHQPVSAWKVSRASDVAEQCSPLHDASSCALPSLSAQNHQELSEVLS